jgi:phage gp36-like protein
MAYSVKGDIVEKLPEDVLIGLTDDAGIGAVDDSVVDRAIADADATIDAHCGKRYTVPLSTVPPMIRQVSVDLAIFNLYARRDIDPPDVRKDKYKEALRFLEKVLGGRIDLGAATPVPTNSGSSVTISSEDRVFSRTKLDGF